jgi:hypothetical protein
VLNNVRIFKKLKITIMKLNNNQKALNEYLNGGNKLIQTNNKLYMGEEVVNGKTFVSLMFKLYGVNFNTEMVKHVIKKD